MARFSGLLGFAHTVKVRPGVSSEVITEKGPYFGDFKRKALSFSQGESVNSEIRTTNTVEIMADDEYVNENIFAIRFVEWAGVAWSVVEATSDPERPRLLLRLGGAYNGPRADEPAGEEAQAPGGP